MGDEQNKSNVPESADGKVESGKQKPQETPEEKRLRLEREKETKKEKVSQRTALRAQIELEPPMTHYYELGEYENAEVEGKYETVEGSVDATPYPARLYEEKFYRDKSKAAKLLLKVFDNQRDRFTDESKELIKKHMKELDKLASQQEFEPKKFKASFEKGYSSQQIFGTDGIYNFILTFQRVMDAYAHDEKTLLESKAHIRLKIGTTQKNKEERYVRTVSAKGEQPPQPEIVPGKKNPQPSAGSEGTSPEEYPTIGHEKDEQMLVAGTAPGGIVPSAEHFNEQIDVKAASSKLMESYTLTGIVALVSGLNKIPENQRQAVLDEVFKQMGEKDPVKAFALMKEVIKYEREGREEQLLKGLQEKIEKAPTENEKNYWHIQLALFEMGQIDEKGKPKLSNAESQEKMREVLRLYSELLIDALPDEVQEMAKEQKEYLETTMRRNIAADMVETATLSLEAMMKNKKDADTYVETSFESLKKESRADIADDLDNWYDSDAEVYMSASHVFEALRLLITHQYPKDAKTEEIQNPIEHYYNKLMNGQITEIKLEEGESAVVNDCLKDNPETVVGPQSIDLKALFVDMQKEKNLYEQYQNGEERLGEDGMYNAIVDTRDKVFGALGVPKGGWRTFAGYATALIGGPLTISFSVPQALGDAFSDNRDTFLETNEGGFIQNSGKMFPKNGQLYELMKDVQGDAENMGAVEKLQIEKIKQLLIMQHYDEARLLCMSILQDRLDEKLKMRPETMSKETELFNSLKEDYGEKINAQVRLQLSQQGIDDKSFEAKPMLRPSGEPYKNLDEYINDRVEAILQQKAYIKVQSLNAEEGFTEDDVNKFTAYEKQAYDLLAELDGHGWWDMKEENADIAKVITQTVVEIAIIELVTWGAGTEVSAALAASRFAGIGLRVAEFAARVPRIGGALVRIGEYGSTIGGSLARATLFVEAQSAMHGRLVNPASADGAYQIALMAATLGVAGKAQQFMRGTTVGARALAEGVPEGLARFSPARPLHELSLQFGRVNSWLLSKGKIGTGAASALEVGGEIGALQMLHYAEQEATTNLDDITKFLKLEEAGLIDKETSERIKQYALYRQAIKDPSTWSSFAHTAGIVLGLRGGKAVAGRLGFAPAPVETPTIKTIEFGKQTYRPNQEILIQGLEGEPVKARVVGIEKAEVSPDIIATRLRVKVEDGAELVVKAGEIIPPKTAREKLQGMGEKIGEAGGKLKDRLKSNKDGEEPQLDSQGGVIFPRKGPSGRAKSREAKAEAAKEDAKKAEQELKDLAEGETTKPKDAKNDEPFETPVDAEGRALDKKPKVSGRRGRAKSAPAEKAGPKPRKTAEILSKEAADAAGKAIVARENAVSSTNPERSGDFARIAEKAAEQAESSAKDAASAAEGAPDGSPKAEAAKDARLMAEGARESATIARHAANEKSLKANYGDNSADISEKLEAYLARTAKMTAMKPERVAEFRSKILESLNADTNVRKNGKGQMLYERRFDDVKAEFLEG